MKAFTIGFLGALFILLLIVFTKGQYHLGNPSMTETAWCQLAGGQEQSFGLVHHCAA